ncbi:NnrS family protein, partial [Sphingobium jiangsuense]|uniref:NnrS family protein n=1 Tax=Sphingobium jiangsuense TaxID=870476 RepID=UPI0024E0ABD1
MTLDGERRPVASVFLRGAFRPFFLGGALWAAVALALWLLSFSGLIGLPGAMEPPVWHRHEMLFGFVGAVVAGFLLTAIANWTGRPPVSGAPLAALFALWIAGRAVLLGSAVIGPLAAAAVDAGFFVVLALVAGREIVAAKNRNLPMVVLVLLLGAAGG